MNPKKFFPMWLGSTVSINQKLKRKLRMLNLLMKMKENKAKDKLQLLHLYHKKCQQELMLKI